MKFKSTIIWGLILLLLAGFVYYYEIVGGRERKKAEEQAKRVFVYKVSDITRLELDHGEERLRCIKSEKGDWQLVEPVNYPADNNAIYDILNTLSQAAFERALDTQGEEVSGFGLNKPGLTLRLASPSQEYTLLLGNETPTRSFLYAKRGDDPKILLLQPGLGHAFQKNTFDLRDKRVLSVAEAKVSKIELEYIDRKLILNNDPKTGWQITAPKKLKADPDEVSALINRLNSLRVKEFVAETAKKLSDFGLDQAEIKITLYSGDQDQKSLLIGQQKKNEQGVFAKLLDRPQIMLLNTEVMSEFKKQVFDLRERRVLIFDTGQVDELKLKDAENLIHLKRYKEEWRMIQPEAAPAKGYMVESMLYDLAHLKAKEFIENSPKAETEYGLDDPQLELSLTLGYEGQTFNQQLVFGNENKSDKPSVYVKRDDGQIFLVPKETIEQLRKKPDDLKRDLPKKDS
jgi:hypothetical protein